MPLESQNCPVCFQSVTDAVTGLCGHQLCAVCSAKWGQVDGRCPLCRRAFVNVRAVVHLHAWRKLWQESSTSRCIRVLSPCFET